MKTHLHKLAEGFIIISDENIKEEDWFYKVIAQQVQIDFSALSGKEQKKIGWFDVEKLAFKEFMFPEKLFYVMKNSSQNEYLLEEEYGKQNTVVYFQCVAFIKGFQKAQELLSDKRFTLEDMQKALQELSIRYSNGYDRDFDIDFQEADFIIQSLSKPKSWEVECIKENGKIKILKLL